MLLRIVLTFEHLFICYYMQAAAFVNRKMKKFFVHRDEKAQKVSFPLIILVSDKSLNKAI